jgi:transposase InsO family protein
VWVEPEIRDAVTAYLVQISKRSGLPIKQFLKIIGLSTVKYYRWLKRAGSPRNHNGKVPKTHWLTPAEVQAIINFAREHYSENDYFLKDGYRRVAYKMIDSDIAYVSPSSVYRVLRRENLLNKWNTNKNASKGLGFKQPDYTHKHWHVDIKYLNFNGSFLFLISVLDGYSRYVLHHEVRHSMTEHDVQCTVLGAKEKYPNARPRIITDNGCQFISKEFKLFIKDIEAEHIRTSVNYPQANGKIERFHRTISQECLRVKAPVSLNDFINYISNYIRFYNTERLHASLHYLTPDDYLNNRFKQKLEYREAKLADAENRRADYWNELHKAA